MFLSRQTKNSILTNWKTNWEKKRFVQILLSRPLRFITSIIIPMYFLILDIFSNKKIISDYPTIHIVGFSFCAILIMTTQLLNEFDKSSQRVRTEKFLGYARNLLQSIANIVNYKLKRFRTACKEVKSRDEVFPIITRPDLQIAHIFDKLIDLFTHDYKAKEDLIDINLLYLNKRKKKWEWSFDQEKFKRSNPEKLMNENSTARQAYDKGTPLFYPEKTNLNPGENYYWSDRDKDSNGKNVNGSIFCSPFSINSNGMVHNYIFSVNFYKHTLCKNDDEDLKYYFSRIFDQFRHRIELELCLHLLKKIKKRGQANARKLKSIRK